uniref:CFAP20 domain containing n=2 Tax=Canis lupus familiaris TaxID=9615 RepID=A0A8P0PH27_CANLF
MFKNEYQEFDKEVKSFVFVLEGSSQTNKIQLPRENKQILGLIQRFLVLQIYIPLGQDFSTELLITDLGNIKRRLYLSTVHKELSSTPLHAKIPLFMIKRKIWCNLCIDLVAFTSEIFKGAVFQSLDGIIVSANCKLRKIFTLKCKPQDTADKDAGKAVPFPTDEPTDIIPRSCQLTTDVPQVTQLLNMTKLRQTEIKFGGHPLSSAESDQFINRGTGSTRNSKHQDVCHIAFGSRVLGPPPLSGRRNNMRISSEERREGSSCIKGSSEKEYDWRNYQPSQMSESELQMLASLRRQQNEELEDTGASHGLSASQVDNCNVSISTSSDDTTTWNSCLPPPVNQGRHYQKEMNPPSPSNPRDWLNMLSPPIVPSSRQPTDQHPDSSGSLSAQGEDDPSVEEDEEVLTLLYDPCLNCYFDPQTGKYYELV